MMRLIRSLAWLLAVAAAVVFALLLGTTTNALRWDRNRARLQTSLAGKTRLRSSLQASSRIAAAVVLVVGVVVLIGWTFGLAVLTQVIPGLVAMNPGTAVAFLLAGVSLWLLQPEQADRRRRRIGAACGLAVALVGLQKLGDYLLGWELVGVDQWLFRAALDSNRIAPNTALNFLLAGLALLLLHVEDRRVHGPAQLLALASALVALLALIGYGYSITAFYGIASYIPMAVPTALAFAVLAVGLLHARPDRGLMAVVTRDGVGSLMARRLLVASIAIPLVLGWLWLLGAQMELYDTAFGASLLVMSNIVVFMALVWWNAGLIDRAEAQRKQADEALRASETFYHLLVESLPQNIFRKDREGRFTFCNRRFCQTLGRPPEAILGRTDPELFPAELAEKYRCDDAMVMQAGTVFEAIEEHVTPDGQTRYVHIIKVPLSDPDGAIIGTQGIFWDVTASKEAEAQLRAQNVLLQEMARSERQAHEALKQAQSRMVQTAKLAGLGQMIAGVAHEINNPLSFVNNNVAVLQRDVGELRELLALYRQADDLLAQVRPELLGQIRDLCERVDVEYTLENFDGLMHRTREGLRRIQQIVKDLRVFARLDESELNEVDLNTGIESTVNIILGYAKKQRVHLALELGPLPTVVCFSAKINQVVMNLLSNAIDACDEGGTVTVRSRAEPEGVCIEVADTGSGIPPAIRERIFDPFFTTKPIGVGTGLGLSISYGIVQDHGGTIEVESTPGQGTCFSVHLPLRPAPRETDHRPARGATEVLGKTDA